MTVNSLWISSGLTVQNGGLVQNTQPFTVASDRRLKRDITYVQGAVEKISKLKGVYFNWLHDKPNDLKFLDNRRHIGLIAQDVREIVPEAVSEIQNGEYLGVDYGSLVSLLIAAFNEIQAGKKLETDDHINNDGVARYNKRCLNKFFTELASIDDLIENLTSSFNEMRDSNDLLKATVHEIAEVNQEISRAHADLLSNLKRLNPEAVASLSISNDN